MNRLEKLEALRQNEYFLYAIDTLNISVGDFEKALIKSENYINFIKIIGEISNKKMKLKHYINILMLTLLLTTLITRVQ